MDSQKHSSLSLLTFNEVLNLLKLKPSRLRSAVFHKEIPFIKVGRLIRFQYEDLVRWLEGKKEGQQKTL